MNDPQGKEILARIIELYEQHGTDPEHLAEPLMELRERALAMEDPLFTKVLRLTAEHLREHGDFLVQAVDPEEVGGKNNFEYLLQLFSDPANKYNREDLASFRDHLKLYPEVPVPPSSGTDTLV